MWKYFWSLTVGIDYLNPYYYVFLFADLIQRLRTRERERERERERQRSSTAQRRSSRERDSRRTLSYDAAPFYMPSDTSPAALSSPEIPTDSSSETLSQYRRQLGERLYPRVRALQPVSTYLPCRRLRKVQRHQLSGFMRKPVFRVSD